MNEIVLNDVPIRFPFEPYDVQKNYMQKVLDCLQKKQNGVLESPTGTGKTLCLLCASLAWLELKKAQHRSKALSASMTEDSNPSMIASISSQLQSAVGGMWKQGLGLGCPKIIYSSRTHSQLSQAVNELKKTTYRHMKVSVLGSRDQMCVHPEVSKETSGTNKVHMCQIRVKGRNCYFYNQVEHKKMDPEVKGGLLDMEDLVKLGKKRTFCPYYMAREIRQEADIIFLPYNYLLDPKSRKAHSIELQGNIVIFDEAHNVEKMCEESASLQIRSTDIAMCIEEVTHVMQKLHELTEKNLGAEAQNALMPEDFSLEDLYILKTVFLQLEKAVDDIVMPSDGSGTTYPGSYMVDLLEKADLNAGKKAIVLDVLEKLIQYLTMNSSSPFQRKGAGLQKFSDLIKIVFSKDNFSMAHLEYVKQCYKVHVSVEEKRKPYNKDGWGAPKLNPITAKTGKLLSYWCFNPGFGMKDLADHGLQSIILTSGTLSPLEPFASELQIPFPVLLENPHIIRPSQVWVGTICKGPDGHVLNSSYQNRNKPEYVNSLGMTILNLCRVIPGGLLVFFPSYPLMKMCQENWQNSGIWSGLNNLKPVFIEPQTKDGFLSAMNDFYEKVRDPALKGACFLAVCRGKVSEGLDFANRNGRAVVITGLPYPPFKDPRVVLKQKYLEDVRKKTKKGLTGGAWYKLEASRAVNQAIGRVIRHKDDYGAIILCDKRFGDFSFKQELSSWVRPHMKVHETFQSALKEVIQFFRTAKHLFPEPELREPKKENESTSSSGKNWYDESPITSSTTRVAANAFEPVLGRSVASTSRSKPNAQPTKEKDLNSIYSGHTAKQTDKEDVSSKPTPKTLFTDFDQTSSILDFNSLSAKNQMNRVPMTDSANLAPKRKKIKVVNRSEKNLENFLQDSASSCPAASVNASSSRPSTSKQEMKKIEMEKQVKSAKYIREVKETLSAEEYDTFSGAIKTYKSTSDIDTLIAVLLQLFANDSAKRPLFIRFSPFLHSEHRDQLSSTYEDLISL